MAMTKDPEAAAPATETEARSSGVRQSGFYRAVWRWHFYAGLFSIPVIVMLCLSGIVWLFGPQLNGVLYNGMRNVEPGGQAKSYEDQLAVVERAYPEATISGTAPPVSAAKATRFDLTTKGGKEYSVFVNPYTGKETGHRDNGKDPAKLALGLHGSFLTAKVPFLRSEVWGDRVIEIVASWSVLLLATGIFLWWPRGKRRTLQGVLVPRTSERKGSRTIWRDVHAITGVVFSFITIFFLVTGLMWSGVWSPKVYTKAADSIGAGITPDDMETSSTKVDDLVKNGKAGWASGQLPVPVSGERASSGKHASHDSAGTVRWDPAKGVPLDIVVTRAQELDFPAGYEIYMPEDEKGTYSIANWPDLEGNPNQRNSKSRTAFIDQYTGKVLGDYPDSAWKPLYRASSTGIALHEGRQFGGWNQIATLIATIAILVSVATSLVMWRKRKPQGLGAPPHVPSKRVNFGLFSIAAALGVLMPMLGISLLAVVVFESLVVHRVPRIARALGAS